MRTSPSRILPSISVSPKTASRLMVALAALVCASIAVWLFAIRNVRFDKAPRAPSYDTNSAHGASFTSFAGEVKNCDVLVTGGTPAGIAAALAAARRGANVVLVEPREKLGGDIVYAMLNMFDVPVRPGEASPVHGIFAEFYDQLGLSCDIDKAERLFGAALAAEPSLRVYNRTRALRVLKDGDAVVGAILRSSAGKDYEVRARVVIDATNDASFAARAGAGYYLGRENANSDKRMQSAGLLFSVSGVDWNQVLFYVRGKRPMRAGEKSGEKVVLTVKSTVENDRTPKSLRKPQVWLRLGGAHGNYAWERGDMVKRYRPLGNNIVPLSINFGRQTDGTVVLNTINIVGVNGLDPASVKRAHREAASELPRFVNYLRRAMPGFAKARLAQVAPELYIRETRHIHGYYALKVADIRAETRFFDRIAFASYPLDLHPYVKGQLNPFGARRYYYTLPLRSLVPRGVNNVFVASRSLSATYSAAGSARVIPITMAAGEAAGAAAWVCVRDSVSPHQLMGNSTYVHKIQDSLRAWGCDIGDVYPTPQQRTKEKVDRPTA